MAEINVADFLKKDGPVALIIKQPLEPVDNDERVLFPPTYPLTHWKGRVHTIRDGDYRVSVQLPPDSRGDKEDKKENQKPGYQIDHFPDGTNVCEIDSIQSQSNRIEPLFKTLDAGRLVPQIEIKIGTEKKNLLDIGHRAGDAAVRMSTMAAEFHDAFIAAKSKNFFKLAMIAPTSLVFGVWDSRSSKVKVQRALKAQIRATNVHELSRSAQYTPAADYVDVGAIGDDVKKKEGTSGDVTNLSQEGMVHALSTQGVGGVMLTEKSSLVRTVTVNIEAIRSLRGSVPKQGEEGIESEPKDGTDALQSYILGLALIAAIEEPELNLREGCHLHNAEDESKTITRKLIYRSKSSEDWVITDAEVLKYAKSSKKAFFEIAGIGKEETVDHPDVKFASSVAENFLGRPKDERDKIRAIGPVTQDALNRFDAKKKTRGNAGDPNEKLRKLVEKIKANKNGTKLNVAPVNKLNEFLVGIEDGADLKNVANQMKDVLNGDDKPSGKISELEKLLPADSPESKDKKASNDGAEEQEVAE